MSLTRDLKSPKLIHAKGVLFAFLGLLSAAMLLALTPTWKAAVLLGICIWAFCRFYYYLFYVLERYLGRERRFAGVVDAVRFLLSKPKAENRNPDSPPYGADTRR